MHDRRATSRHLNAAHRGPYLLGLSSRLRRGGLTARKAAAEYLRDVWGQYYYDALNQDQRQRVRDEIKVAIVAELAAAMRAETQPRRKRGDSPRGYAPAR